MTAQAKKKDPTATPFCGFKGFAPGFMCKRDPGHEGDHDYGGFLPEPRGPVEAPKRTPIAWSIEEGNLEGHFDIFRDRRAAAYDLDLQGAVAFVRQHRSFRRGDTITVLDRQGHQVSS